LTGHFYNYKHFNTLIIGIKLFKNRKNVALEGFIKSSLIIVETIKGVE